MKNVKDNAKAMLINKINNYCNVAIGSVSGVFAGNAWAVVRNFMKNPEAFLRENSAPWYMPLITSGIGTAVIIAAITFGKKIAASKLGIDLDGAAGGGKPAVTKSTLVSGGASLTQSPGHSGSGRKLPGEEAGAGSTGTAGTKSLPEGTRNPAADNNRGAVSKKRKKRAKGKK